MSSKVNVRSIQALDDLKSQLGSFGSQASEALREAESQLQQTLAWLEGRVREWQGRVGQCQAELQRTQRALAACEASGSYDRDGHYHAPNCSAYQAALSQAQARLREAQEALQQAQHWLRTTQSAAQEYRRQASRLQALVGGRIGRARAFLSGRSDDLKAFLALQGAGNVATSAVPSAAAARKSSALSGIRSSAVREAKQQEIELVQKTGQGSQVWTPRQLARLRRGRFPKGFHGHHTNNVARFPHWAGNPDNIRFLRRKAHFAAHRGSWRNNTSGKMLNRRSMMVQRLKYN